MSTELILPFDPPAFTVDAAANTVFRLVYQRARETPRRRCLGTREFIARDDESPEARGRYEWYTYLDVVRMASELFHGLQEIGLRPGDCVGIMAASRVEWAVTDIACGALGAVTVPVHETLSPDDIALIINEARVDVLFLTLHSLRVWSVLQQRCPTVRDIVLFDDRYDDRWFLHRAWAHAAGMKHPLPTAVTVRYRSGEECDRDDQREGLLSKQPCTASRTSGRRVRDDAARRLVCEPIGDHQAGCYSYLPSLEVSHELDRVGSPLDALHLLSYTFHGIMHIGRTSTAYKGVDFAAQYADPDTLNTPPYALDAVAPADLMTIVYTSGTTGQPKGVRLSHGNVLWASASMAEHRVVRRSGIQEINLSYLPCALIYQRAVQGAMWYCSGATGFWCGAIKDLTADIQVLQPTIFIAVPRILNRIFEGIMGRIERLSVLRRFFFFVAFSIRRKAMQKGVRWPAWTNYFFAATKDVLGGRCALCVTGSAPLTQKVGEFLHLACDTRVLEGWGMTETAAHGVVQPVSTTHWGTVGVTLDSATQVRLVSVPDMDYLVTDEPNPRGEVWIRGPSVFSGYYNDDAKTRETLTDDGWFMTGDIGEYDRALGELRLVDRKGCIFKLAQGEFICTALIEETLMQLSLVQQCLVYGDRSQSYLLAVVVPNFTALRAALATQSIAGKDLAGLRDDELVVREAALVTVLREVEHLFAARHFRAYETPRAVMLEWQPWTAENDYLTPALKIRRSRLIARYRPYLTSLYHHINRISSHRPSPQQIALTVIKVMDSAALSEVSTQITSASGLSNMSTQ